MNRLSQIILLAGLLCLFIAPLHAQSELQRITDANARALTQLLPIGRGQMQELRWSPDGRWLAIQTPIGIWLHDNQHPHDNPVLLRVLDRSQVFAFSPDSDEIAIAGCRGQINTIYDFSGLGRENMCAISETHLWNLSDLRQPAAIVIPNGQANILQLVISTEPLHNSSLVAALKENGSIQLTNGARSWLLTLPDLLGRTYRIALNANGRFLAVLSTGTSDTLIPSDIYLFDLEHYITSHATADDARLHGFGSPAFSDIRFSEDGQLLFAYEAAGFWQWNTFDLSVAPVFQATPPVEVSFQPIDLPSEDVLPIAFSPGNRFLVMGREPRFVFGDSMDDFSLLPGILRLHDPATGDLVYQWTETTTEYALNPVDTHLAYLDMAGSVHVYDLGISQEIAHISDFGIATTGVLVSPENKLIYSRCNLQLPYASGLRCALPSLHVGDRIFEDMLFTAEAITPDSRLLAGREMIIRDAMSGDIVRELHHQDESIWRLDFSPGGDWLAVSGDFPRLIPISDRNRPAILLNMPYSQIRPTSPWTPHVSFSPDGQWVATVSFDGKARLWNAANGTLLATLESEVAPDYEWATTGDGVAFSPDGQLIAFGSCYSPAYIGTSQMCADARIYVYSVVEALALGELQPDDAQLILMGATHLTVSITFSPDGSLLVASSAPATHEGMAGSDISIWSALTGELLTVLQAYGATDIAFSPDGSILYSNSDDGVVYRWGVQ